MKTEENKTSILEVAYHAGKRAELKENNQGDYSTFLNARGVKYREDGNYLIVGSDPRPGDKVIYVSCIVPQISRLIDVLVPYLVTAKLSFALIKNQQKAKLLLSGSEGAEEIGKIVLIYISEISSFSSTVEQVNKITAEFNGPAISDYAYLGGILYTNNNLNNNRLIETNEKNKRFQTFKDKYIVLSVLKEEIKGDVLKALYFKGFLRLGKCVIKEGKKFIHIDNNGNDMTERIRWQQKVHLQLSEIINIPKALDFFEENGNAYLVIEYIKGKSLEQVIKEIYKERNWTQLPKSEKLKLLEIIIGIIEILDKIHTAGFVHRDLNHTNFLITKDKKIYLIDWELSYGTTLKYPLPPFRLGTAGFMSPEQIAGIQPTEKEDIFALGALLFVFFTNFPPLKLDQHNPYNILKSILFFTGDHLIAEMIVNCLNPVIKSRAELYEIRNVIHLLKENYKTESPNKNITLSPLPKKTEINQLIDAGLNGLTTPQITDNGGLFKIFGNFDPRIGKRNIGNWGIGFFSPITSIIYLISNAKLKNANINSDIFWKKYLKNQIQPFLIQEEQLPGLFFGSAGKALALYLGAKEGLLIIPEKLIHNQIETCFNRISESLDLANGVAGQLIAACLIYKSKPSNFLKNRIDEFAQIIIDKQNRDGSWSSNNSYNQKTKMPDSLENGNVGIILSLIKYDSLFSTDQHKLVIEKSLKRLKSDLAIKKKKLFTKVLQSGEDQSLFFGEAGIALVFLYAYEYLKTIEYKNVAEEILRQLPEYRVCLDFSIATGLSGIGFTYIEAARICNHKEWEKRAVWIYNVLANSSHELEPNKILWKTGPIDEYDGGIITGNPGIIFFLSKLQRFIDQKSYTDCSLSP